MIFGINTSHDTSKLSQITYNNFKISLVVFTSNITTNHAITYTNMHIKNLRNCEAKIFNRFLFYKNEGTEENTARKKIKVYVSDSKIQNVTQHFMDTEG